MAAHVLVVGGSLAGLRAAEAVATSAFDGEITVLGEESHEPYNRPALSKKALTAAEAYVPEGFRRKAGGERIRWRLGQRVTASDLANGTIELATGEQIAFHGLVAASGLRARRLPVDGPAAGRHVVRTAEDAEALRRTLAPGTLVVVVGGGFLGCEVAASATARGAEVTLVYPERFPLELMLGNELAQVIAGVHEQHGVRLRGGQTVTGFLGGSRVEGVSLASGEVLAAAVVVEAVGAVPNVEWLEGNGLDLSSGVLCDNDLRVVGQERVVAVGDVARFPNPLYPDRPQRTEHWNMVPETAKRGARTLLAELGVSAPPADPFVPIPSFWSDQYDLRLQAFGDPLAGMTDRRVLAEDDGQARVIGYFRSGELSAVAGLGPVAELLPYRAELAARAQALARSTTAERSTQAALTGDDVEPHSGRASGPFAWR